MRAQARALHRNPEDIGVSVKHVIHAKPNASLWFMLFGLMFRTRKTLVFAFPKRTLLFDKDPYVSVHTWFVFFPLTLLYLDEHRKVVEKAYVQPFSSFTPKHRACYIVEIPGRTPIAINDSVTFK